MHHGFAPPLNLANDSVSFAMSIAVFSHLNESAALSWLQEIQRVLKPGGALSV